MKHQQDLLEGKRVSGIHRRHRMGEKLSVAWARVVSPEFLKQLYQVISGVMAGK